MKAGWDEKSLGETCDVLDRLRKPITKKDRIEGPVPYYGATGIVDYVEGHIFDELLVLVGEDGAKWGAGDNTAFEISGKTWVNNHAHVLRPYRDEVLDQWLIYFLNFSDLSEYITGVTVPKLNQKKLRSIPIPIPPLDEQKRIVAVLDEAFEGLDRARAHTEANLQNAHDLYESFVNQVTAQNEVNTTKVSFADVATIESVLVDPREEPFLDLPHLGAGNMVSGRDEVINVKTAREEKLRSGKFPFDENMILYSKIRPYLRKVARPNFKGLCSADVYPLVPVSDVIDKDYLFHLLLGPDFTEYAIAGSGRVGMPKVNRKHLFNYNFDLPDLDVQKASVLKINEMMRKTEKLSSEYEAKLSDLEDLRQSLLQKAFAGELT